MEGLGTVGSGQWPVDRFLLRDQGWATERRKAGVGPVGRLDSGQWTGS